MISVLQEEVTRAVGPATTVQELTEEYPISHAVLHSRGLTARHVEGLTLAALAERDGIDLGELLHELRAAARRAPAAARHPLR